MGAGPFGQERVELGPRRGANELSGDQERQ
jgi:hypothetical protein